MWFSNHENTFTCVCADMCKIEFHRKTQCVLIIWSLFLSNTEELHYSISPLLAPFYECIAAPIGDQKGQTVVSSELILVFFIQKRED